MAYLKVAGFCAAIVFASLPMQVKAAFECRVRVASVLVYAGGGVNVLHTGRGEYTVICNLQSDYGGVSPTTCAVWTTMLQAIKRKAGTAEFYFSGDGSCASMGTYGSAPVPAYVGDVTP